GVLVGIGLLTKVSTIFLAGLVPLAILLRWWINRDQNVGARHASPLLREGASFGLPALLLAAIWWLRDLSVYGFPDIFGLGLHNLVVADQLRNTDYISQIGLSSYLSSGLQTTFNSFWGQFGWLALPLPGWLYALIVGFLAITGLGLL